jgi:hypothetical protein
LGVQIWNFVYDTQFLPYGTMAPVHAQWLFPNAGSNRWPHLRIAQKTNNIFNHSDYVTTHYTDYSSTV